MFQEMLAIVDIHLIRARIKTFVFKQSWLLWRIIGWFSLSRASILGGPAAIVMVQDSGHINLTAYRFYKWIEKVVGPKAVRLQHSRSTEDARRFQTRFGSSLRIVLNISFVYLLIYFILFFEKEEIKRQRRSTAPSKSFDLRSMEDFREASWDNYPKNDYGWDHNLDLLVSWEIFFWYIIKKFDVLNYVFLSILNC